MQLSAFTSHTAYPSTPFREFLYLQRLRGCCAGEQVDCPSTPFREFQRVVSLSDAVYVLSEFVTFYSL